MHSLRKNAKPLNQLKGIHTEHLNKLQYKHQLETDLIEDLRSFCKQRAQIEKDYGQALQKLASTYLSKKDVITLGGNDDENRRQDGRSIWYVWRCLLDQTQGMAQARLMASDTQQRLSDQLKPVKMVRIATNKHIVEQLKSLQSELAASLQEMVKAHKVYVEEEKQAHDARTKAKDADDKVRKRSTNIFHSMAQLQKNSAKLSSRRDACETRSTAARNEYLFQLASVNAHLEHYFSVDITDLAKILDGEVFEKIQEVFTGVSRHELECCGVTQEHFSRVMCDAMLISREFTWNQFVQENPAFAEKVQYQYEPTEGDQSSRCIKAKPINGSRLPINKVNLLHPPSSKEESLLNVARKLAKRLVQRDRQIKDYQTEMRSIQAGRVTPQHQEHDSHGNSLNNDDMLAYNQEYVEHKVEELQHAIRREEIEKVKVQACLDLLQDSGVEVASIISDAYTAVASLDMEPDSESLDQVSYHTYTSQNTENDDEAYDLSAMPNANEDELTNQSTPTSSTSVNEHKDRWARKRQSTADKSLEGSGGGGDEEALQPSSSGGETESQEGGGITAVALFEFQASQPDELDLVVDEVVVVIDENVLDGWIKVRSMIDSREGLIPAAFVRIDRPGGDFWSQEPNELDNVADWSAVTDQETTVMPVSPPPGYEIVRALYEFSGSSSDELSFPAGQLIRLISRESAPGVDDGWWEGELISPSSTAATAGSDNPASITGRSSAPPEGPGFMPRGFFPSMIVEPVKRVTPQLCLFPGSGSDEVLKDAQNTPKGTEEAHVPDAVNGLVSSSAPVSDIQQPPIEESVEVLVTSPVDRPGPPLFQPPPPAQSGYDLGLEPVTPEPDSTGDSSSTDTEGQSSSTSAEESDTGTVRARDETPIKDLEEDEETENESRQQAPGEDSTAATISSYVDSDAKDAVVSCVEEKDKSGLLVDGDKKKEVTIPTDGKEDQRPATEEEEEEEAKVSLGDTENPLTESINNTEDPGSTEAESSRDKRYQESTSPLQLEEDDSQFRVTEI